MLTFLSEWLRCLTLYQLVILAAVEVALHSILDKGFTTKASKETVTL